MKKQIITALLILVMSVTLKAVSVGHTMEIAVATDVVRTWADIQADNYNYGPKQSYDSGTQTTHIWMPYGEVNGVYYDLDNVFTSTPSADVLGLNHTITGGSNGRLVFRLHFSSPITQFTFVDSWTFISLTNGGEFATQYSVDGTNWVTMALDNTAGDEYPEPFTNFTSPVIETNVLYIRLLMTAGYFQSRTAGVPEWGEAGFTGNQYDLFVVSPQGECANVWANGLGLASDINQDCIVNLLDLASLATNWMDCNDPQGDAACQAAWN